MTTVKEQSMWRMGNGLHISHTDGGVAIQLTLLTGGTKRVKSKDTSIY